MIAEVYTPFAAFAEAFGLPAACLLVVWFFALGSAVGSFLNVVAYRLPLGMSMSHPPSRCPACERPIRWYHNVPIAGWLVLGGRCADCGARISPRYPLVELIVAAASAVVAWTAIAPEPPVEGTAMYSTDLVRIGYQLVLVWTLSCAALLEFDGHAPPVKLLAAVLAIGVVGPFVDPGVWRGWGEDVIVRGLAATVLASLLFAALAWPLLVERSDRAAIRTAAIRGAELVTAGVYLGLAAVPLVAVVATAVFAVTRVAARARPGAVRFAWAASLLVGTLVWMVVNCPMVDAWSRLAGPADPRHVLFVTGVTTAAVAVVGRWLRGR